MEPRGEAAMTRDCCHQCYSCVSLADVSVRIGTELGRLMLGMGGLTVVYITGELHPFRGQRFISV